MYKTLPLLGVLTLALTGCPGDDPDTYEPTETPDETTFVPPPPQGIEAWIIWSEGTITLDDGAVESYEGTTYMVDEVFDGPAGDYETGDIICEYTWDAAANTEDPPATLCDECDFTFELQHSNLDRVIDDAPCQAWYAQVDDNSFEMWMGFATDFEYVYEGEDGDETYNLDEATLLFFEGDTDNDPEWVLNVAEFFHYVLEFPAPTSEVDDDEYTFPITYGLYYYPE